MERYVYTVPPPPGSTVWERRDHDPMADPASLPPLRGGTLIGWEGEWVTVISGTPLKVAGRRQVMTVKTERLRLADLDPSATAEADHNFAGRVSLGRRILRAVSDRGGAPEDRDHTWLAWAATLWSTRPHWPRFEPEEHRGGDVDMPAAYEGASS